MNLFFEESGDFKAGAVLSQQGEAYQVELPSGKRTKVKAKDVLVQFNTPSPAELLAEAEAAAKSALALIEKQYELGAVSYPALLIAQRDYQKTRINVVAARAQRYADTAALFQALGGGWWNRDGEGNATPAKRAACKAPTKP